MICERHILSVFRCQGVWNRREIQMTRPALYHIIIHALQTVSIWIRNICLMNYRVYNNLFWIFLIQMEYRLQSKYNHMVGRAASFVSPFYSILLGLIWIFIKIQSRLHSIVIIFKSGLFLNWCNAVAFDYTLLTHLFF